MSDTDYNILLSNNIASSYRKCENGVKFKIDKETKKVTESLDLSKKMKCYASSLAFFTIKDYKSNFWNNTKCSLINPAKNESGLVCKTHLDTITFLFPQKNKSSFIKSDIVEFNSTISEELLNQSISFARSIITTSDLVIDIIHHWRKSLFFDKISLWVNKGNNSLFDVTIGSYDGAEICKLVGLYLLNRLSTVIDKSIVGLYRDDGLAALNNANVQKLDRVKKDVIALFKEGGISITIRANLIETDFLYVIFNLATKK